jgi:hypothetical protein
MLLQVATMKYAVVFCFNVLSRSVSESTQQSPEMLAGYQFGLIHQSEVITRQTREATNFLVAEP